MLQQPDHTELLCNLHKFDMVTMAGQECPICHVKMANSVYFMCGDCSTARNECARCGTSLEDNTTVTPPAVIEIEIPKERVVDFLTLVNESNFDFTLKRVQM